MFRGLPLIEPLERRTLLTVAGGGFAELVAASGLRQPTAMAVGPNADPDVFIAEKDGTVRLFRDGSLLSQPILTLPVDTRGDRGLIGIAVDRNYRTDHYFYVNYTVQTPVVHQRISRFIISGTSVPLVNETVLLDLPAWGDSSTDGDGLTDLGGGLRFAYDGTLLVGVGDSGKKENASSFDNPFGKILRLKPGGGIPADNPFTGGDAWKPYIWAYGLHDPTGISVQPENGIVFINDAGTTKYEEVNRGAAGANYGWPAGEGIGAGGVDPIYVDPHQPTDADAIPAGHVSGGTFFSPGTLTFPVPYGGDYFYADESSGALKVIDFTKLHVGEVNVFATGLTSPVDLAPTQDGDLLCLCEGTGDAGGEILRYTPNGTPAIIQQPKGGSASVAGIFNFTVTVSSASQLSYQWRRDGVDIADATAATYSTAPLTAADDGAVYTVVVRNALGVVTSRGASLAILAAGGGGTGGSGSGGSGTGAGGTGTGGSGSGGSGSGSGGSSGSGTGGSHPKPTLGLIDLVPSIASALPAAAIGGAKGRATLRVYDLGLDPAFGTLNVRLFLSADEVLDANDSAILDYSKAINIRASTFKSLRLKFTYPAAVSGAYHLLAELDPDNTLPETNEANNVAATDASVQIAAPFVDVKSVIGPTAAAFSSGGKASVPLTIFNAGNISSSSAMTIVLSASPGDSFAGDSGADAAQAIATAVRVFTTVVRVKVPPGRGKIVRLKFVLPGDLAAGSYTFVASVDATNVVAESDEANNISVGMTPFAVS